MYDSHYPPSVVAFLAEQDQIRAHRDRLGHELQERQEAYAKLFQELEQERFKVERLQIEVDRITARCDIHARVSHRIVAKMEAMLSVFAAQALELKDEMERAQFQPRTTVDPEEEFFRETQWTPEQMAHMQGLKPIQADINRIHSETRQLRLNDVVSSIDQIDDDDLISAEEIGRHFGAGFPTPEELTDTTSQLEFVQGVPASKRSIGATRTPLPPGPGFL